MKTKRFACLLVALLAVTAQFTACGEKSENTSETGSTTETSQGESAAESGEEKDLPENFNPTGERICPETITVTLTGRQGATKDWQNTFEIEYIKEHFGIDFQCNPFPNDVWDTQMALMLSTDEMPDMVVNAMMKPEDVNRYGSQGYFLPINEYMEYMPNMSQIFEEYPEYQMYLTAPDNNIYGLSRITTEHLGLLSRTFINNTWLENVGMEPPTTLDELTEVLRAFKEQDANGNGDPNDEIPLGYESSMYFRAVLPILSAFGIHTFSPDYILTEKDGVVTCENNTDAYKEFLRYMNMLYSEGLMDQDAFVQTQAEFESKTREERVGYVGCFSAPFVFAGKDMIYDRQWSFVTGLTMEEGQTRVMPISNRINEQISIVINSNTEHPEALCRLLDYFYTPEGQILAKQGVEGETYAGIGEQPGIPGSETLLPLERDDYLGFEKNEFNTQKGKINMAFVLIDDPKYMYSGVVENASDEVFYDIMVNGEDIENFGYWGVLLEEKWRDDSIEKVDTFPRLAYTADESSERANLVTDITSYIQLAKSQFIIGELDIDKDWDTYVQTLEQMGLSRLVEIEQSAYDRMFK